MSKKTSPKDSAKENANMMFNPVETPASKTKTAKVQPAAKTAPVKTQSKPAAKPASKAQPKSQAKLQKFVAKKSAPKLKVQKEVPSAVVSKTKTDTLVLPHDHDSYFVYLKNPLEYRRHLLESSRKILFSLKGYQKVLLIRQKKLEEMRKLKNSVKELIYLNKKFNEMLPKYNMTFIDHHKAEPKVAPPVQKILTPVQARKPVPTKEKTEIEKLEESLANIEKKLRTLQ
ncbi:MAG TPA: hypothetical protein VEC16_06685 [Alphaproteobacteria bacterium]|nr:hypothetical protein [Alphaproteobacteria bacterium]